MQFQSFKDTLVFIVIFVLSLKDNETAKGALTISKRHRIVIFGCGNILLGDDGVGPAVASALKRRSLPHGVLVEDVGTGIRDRLFDYILSPALCPKALVVIDAVRVEGYKPGQILKFRPSEIPPVKVSEFSLHQFPTVNLLAELEKELDVRVEIIGVQVNHLPDRICLGLSRHVAEKVKEVCDMVVRLCASMIEDEKIFTDRASCPISSP